MGDCDIRPIRDCSANRTVESSGVLSREVVTSRMTSLGAHRVSSVSESGYLDCAAADKQVIADKHASAGKEAIAAKLNGAPGFPGSGFAVGCRSGSLVGGQLDFGPNYSYDPFEWDKKSFDKKLFPDKKLAKDLDFAQIPTLAPLAAGLVDRVDSNHDGSMSDREIRRALADNDLNEKEKTVLKIVRDNKESIDDGRGGISLRDIKEFDAKVVQYNKELTMARKFAPELAEFARELHLRGKLADENHDGKFSRAELTAFYKECKQEFLLNPSEQGKRELAALNWGLANFHRYALMTGRPGGGQITSQWLQTQMLRERDSATPPESHQYFLSQSDRLRVERYQSSR